MTAIVVQRTEKMIPIESVDSLLDGYRQGAFMPAQVFAEIEKRMSENGDDAVWILKLDRAAIRAQLDRLPAPSLDAFSRLPLYGIPFAIKDNIDVAGLKTTAGCPDYAYEAATTAPIVSSLTEAGAILVGKTNMSQFAIGLAGERSPYGVPRNPYSADHIPGGSSSGSAVAVATGLVTFSLGTDTAGSGRVPAALNNLVGLKPTRGMLSLRGVVPCCLTLDCVSIFAQDILSAKHVFEVARQADLDDPLYRAAPPSKGRKIRTIGILAEKDREFYGNQDAARLYDDACARLSSLGYSCAPFDYAPFREAAIMLYHGPWMAERDVAVGDFMRAHPDSVVAISRDAILGSTRFSAADAFRAFHRLKELSLQTRNFFSTVDAIFLPTVPTTYTISEVLQDPAGVPERLSIYTNFVNLLDLCAIAIPTGFTTKRLPLGASLIAPAFSEDRLLEAAAEFMSVQ